MSLRDLLTDLAARDITLSLDADGNVSIKPWSMVRPAERATLREHRRELAAILATDEPTDEAPEPEPELYAHGHRVTEAHVRDCLECDSDTLLESYRRGPFVPTIGETDLM